MYSRMHGERCNRANGDGPRGQPWRRSRPDSSEVHEAGNSSEVRGGRHPHFVDQHYQRPMAVLVVTWPYHLGDLANGVGSGSVPSLTDLTCLP